MRRSINKVFIASFLLFTAGQVQAGNPQRAGSAGAPELLINPWAGNTGWAGVNIAGVSGVEASFLNIAGTARTEKTSIGFANTQWLVGGGISINAFGFNQKVGSNGVLGANIMALDYGEWERTTEDNPEGGIGTVSPNTVSIGISYAQKFTESILGGVNIKLYSQSSDNLSVNALCFDAGVQYITGSEKQLKFGITLKNVGPAVAYSGDGKSINLTVPQGGYAQSFEERSATFELPTNLSIGGSYDFLFSRQRITVAGAFQSNSFEKDQFIVGAEYSIYDIIEVRGGYTFFDNRTFEANTSVFTGVTGGLSINVPLGDSDTKFALDYSYRDTDPFSGVHTIGINFEL